jgi:hypothetical protein
MIVRKDPIEVQEKKSTRINMKKLENGFGGIRSLHLKGSDSLRFKDYLISYTIAVVRCGPKGLRADIGSLKRVQS